MMQQRQKQSGQSMVEFALLAPLLLALILSVIELGRYWGARHGVANAAREGARLMILPYGPGTQFGTQEDVNQAAVRATKQFLNITGLAHEAPQVEITPVWYDAVTRATHQSFGARELTNSDQAGILISYQFETPLKLLLVGGDGKMTIKQQVLLDHE